MNARFFDGRRLGPAIVLLLGALGASACSEEAPMGQEMLPVTSGTGATAGGGAMQPAAGGGASGSSGLAGASPGSAGSTGAAGRTGAAGATASAGTGATAGGGAAGMVAAAGTGAAGSGMAGSGAAGSAAAGSGAAGSGPAAGAGGSMGAAGGGAAAGAGGAGGMAASGATFTEVYSIIMTGCGCHATGSGGLSTASKMAAYMNLVGVNSGACAGQKRVVAGDPDNSVLMHALDQTMLGSCMVPAMPRGAAKLGMADLDKVRSWIKAGAMNN